MLIRESKDKKSFIGTFDYNDLNAYLLLVIGLLHPPGDASSFQALAKKAREGDKIPIKLVMNINEKETPVTLTRNTTLTKTIEIFGSGVHRIVILEDDTEEVFGVFTQLRLVRFLWENAKSFPAIDQLYPQFIQGLNVGSHQVISIK